MKKTIVFSVFAIIFVANIFAQAPQSFNYQAVAREDSSLLANANIEVRFFLLQNGSQVYGEEHSTQTNEYGLFTLAVGSGVPTNGNFSTLDWKAGNFELKIEIDKGSGFVALGRQPLRSVPFSMHAVTADSVSLSMDQLTDVGAEVPFPGDVLKWNGIQWETAVDSVADADADATNELQTLSISPSGDTLYLSDNGGAVALPAETIYTGGAGISISGATITNSAPDQAVTLTGGGATSISGSYPNFTIASTDNVDDADADPGNELQSLSLSGTQLSLSNANMVDLAPILPVSPWSVSGSNTFTSTGNVGINNTTPQHPLDVNGTTRITKTGDGAVLLDLNSERNWQFRQLGSGGGTALELKSVGGGGNKNFILTAGRVGIGTTTLTRAKLEVVGYVPHSLTATSYNTTQWHVSQTATRNLSAYFSHHIATEELQVFSDQRIKNIQGISNSEKDLKTLMDIEVTDYTFIDTISNGKRPEKKVIAQQVAQVYPTAVSQTLTDVVPDIFQKADLKDGWILLATDLLPADRVKIFHETGSDIYEVLEVRSDGFKVDMNLHTLGSEPLFVYGREVDDFHTVDYDALSVLNISVTQEQQRIIEAQKAEIADLKEQVEHFQGLEARIQMLESLVPTSMNES